MNWDGKATEDFTDMLQLVASNGTGSLKVQDVTGERRGWVFLEDRDVVAVLVGGYQPRLGRRLTTSGLVSSADMDQVLSVVKDEYDPRIALECVARGLVDAVTIEVLYREFMLSAASSVNEWDVGAYHWAPDATPWEGRSVPVSVPALVSAMARRKEHWTQLWTNLSVVTIPDRIPVRTSSDGQYSPETPDECAVLAAVDGRRTVDQVAGECGFTRFQAGHLLSGLMAKKVLDLLPVDSTLPVRDCLPVQAGYYAPSQPLPDEGSSGTGAPDPEPVVHDTEQPPEPVAPPQRATPHLALPLLPSITGGPSDFYIDLPSLRPAPTGAAPVAGLPPVPTSMTSQAPIPQASAEPAAIELSAAPASQTIPTTRAASEVGSEAEVSQLREDLLRLAAERTAAMDKALLLRAEAATRSAEVDDVAARAEEDNRSIFRLNSLTSEASAIALNQLEGLRLAQAEVARVGEIKVRVDAEAETADQTLVAGQRKFDEASAVQTNLQQELQAVIARQQAVNDEWTSGKEGAARSEASARHADATVAELDQLMNEARERLTALAGAHRGTP